MSDAIGAKLRGIVAGELRYSTAVGWRGGQMRDAFGRRMLGTDGRDAYVGGFAGFAKGIVAGVEILALLRDN